MADVSQWDANELKNLKLDELNLSDERGKRTAKIMAAVKKKFDSNDTTLSQNTAAIGSWTDAARTDTLKDAVEQLESDVASIVTGSQSVDMETIIDSDDVLSVNLNLFNWQKTEKAGVVAFYPVSDMAIEPVVEFSFTETPPEEGDKGLSNPSTITGVSAVKIGRCGKNLVRSVPPGTYSNNGVSFVVASDGSITVSGTAGEGAANFDLSITNGRSNIAYAIPVVSGHTYTVSGCPANGSASTYQMTGAMYDKSGHAIAYNVLNDNGEGKTYTAPSDGYVFLRIRIASGYAVESKVFYPQLEENEIKTGYEKPQRDTYTISLNGTYYGGFVEPTAGTITLTHKMINLADSTVTYNSGYQLFLIDDDRLDESFTPVSDCFTLNMVQFVDMQNGDFRYQQTESIGADKSRFCFKATNCTGVADFKDVFSESKLVYKLQTPIKIQIESERITALSNSDKYSFLENVVYSDADSVQVGYVKSPIRSEYELTQAIIATEGGE